MRNCAGLATLGVGRRGGRPRFARLLLRPSRGRQHPFHYDEPEPDDQESDDILDDGDEGDYEKEE